MTPVWGAGAYRDWGDEMRLLVIALALLAGGLAAAPVAEAQSSVSRAVPLEQKVRLKSIDRDFRRKPFTTVYFGFDLDTLDADARARLRKQARLIRQNPDATFAVTGHADLVGNRAYNRALGMRRARRVVNYLVALGVDRGNLRAMVSMGEDAPAVKVSHRERLNRRVTTRILFPWEDPESYARREVRRTGVPAAAPSGVIVTTSTAGATTTTTTTTGTTTTTATTTTTETKLTGKETRPGNSLSGTGRPDAGSGNGNEPSGDPEGSIGHNRGGDEPVK